LFALICFCLIAGVPAIRGENTGAPPAIIPKPATMEVQGGVFVFGPSTTVDLETEDSGARWVGEYLCTLLSNSMGRAVPLHVAAGVGPPSSIHLSLRAAGALGAEGYEMIVSPHTIRISAGTVAGLFYGVQTLRQMLPPEIESRAPRKERMEVPCVSIQDSPRFSWRGLMLDCSRTFLPPAYVKRTIDRMALYKLNVLHLHLTDDQGWRLEIKKYPKLTTVGARFANQYGGGDGYYSQQEMRELITYAKERNITVVPEIEIPGHSLEVLAAYPELACDLPRPQPLEVHPFWEGAPGFSPPLCAGNDRVFEMYRDILSEVIDLFPSEFIHVGGDEVPKDSWSKCPRCQTRIKDEGLKDVEELQSYFTKRIEKIITAKGRRLIGWDEILQGGLAPGATVMSWRGTEGGVAAANLGHDVVMTPNGNCYFDYSYHTTPTEKVYAYDPVPKEFTGAMAKHILGVQGSMWTHIAISEKAIDYQMYPRLAALAEVAWSPQQIRDWSDFNARLECHFRRFQLLGIRYFNPASVGKKIGAWQASDLSGNGPRLFEWDATPLLNRAGEYEVQVRREEGQKPVYVRSVALLEDGKEISREAFPGPLTEGNDVAIGWLELGKRKSAAHYSVRVILRGTNGGGLAGSVWIEGQSKSRESKVEELKTSRSPTPRP
jgi:hexosaminidase